MSTSERKPSGQTANESIGRIPWLLIFIFWTLVGLSAVIQSYVRDSIPELAVNQNFSLPFLLIAIMPGWYYWALVTPVIFFLGRRFPFERDFRLFPRLLLHLIAGMAFTLPYFLIAAVAFLISCDTTITTTIIWENFFRRFIAGFHLSNIVYWAVLGFGFALNYYRKLQERELQASQLALKSSQLETQLVKAQIDALRMQINPHFLFNTLHAVSALLEDDPSSARGMIARLSDLLRFTLDSSHRQTISLGEELKLLDLYLDIERERFKRRIDIKTVSEPGVLSARIPNFILQPLVENAVKHGVSHRSTTGIIEIRATRHDERLLLEVEDNGNGSPADARDGIGLTNTKERLDKIYGDDYRFSLRERTSGGTIASIEIPFVNVVDESD